MHIILGEQVQKVIFYRVGIREKGVHANISIKKEIFTVNIERYVGFIICTIYKLHLLWELLWLVYMQ